MSVGVFGQDFSRRRCIQTLRDRRALRRAREAASLDPLAPERRALRTEFVGAFIMGFVFGANFVVFVLLSYWWVRL